MNQPLARVRKAHASRAVCSRRTPQMLREHSRMSAPPSGGGTPIENRRQLIEYFAAGNKPRSAWRMGTEHEKFGFHTATLKPLAYDGPDGIRAMLEGMTRFGWEPVVEGNNVIALQRGQASVTLEPGGQFELSGAPLETVHDTAEENEQHLDEVKAVASEIGAGFIGLGFAPQWRREDMHWMPKGRYKIMRDYMPKKGKLGLDMMLRTCTVQTNLDFGSEADMVKKFRVSLAHPRPGQGGGRRGRMSYSHASTRLVHAVQVPVSHTGGAKRKRSDDDLRCAIIGGEPRCRSLPVADQRLPAGKSGKCRRIGAQDARTEAHRRYIL